MDNLFRSKTEKLLAILIALIFLPLVIYDMPFRDDLSRSYWGFLGLSQLGRPFADVLYKNPGFGFEGVNLSPLPKYSLWPY